jgi:hypothetical protein
MPSKVVHEPRPARLEGWMPFTSPCPRTERGHAPARARIGERAERRPRVVQIPSNPQGIIAAARPPSKKNRQPYEFFSCNSLSPVSVKRSSTSSSSSA